MVPIEELKDIVIMSQLTDDMLGKFQSLIDVLHYDEDDLVFREGDPADRFYILKYGKILLEKKIGEKISFAIGAIKPGYSFGWSAMLEEGSGYTTRTVCAEHCEVYSMQSAKLKSLFSEDPQIGHLFLEITPHISRDVLKQRFSLRIKPNAQHLSLNRRLHHSPDVRLKNHLSAYAVGVVDFFCQRVGIAF